MEKIFLALFTTICLLSTVSLIELTSSVPKAVEQITNIDTSPPPTPPYDLPSIYEGDGFNISITIKNVGTEGTISVSLTSTDYVATSSTQTFWDFEAGESHTFRWSVRALNTFGDSPTELRILAQGRGGTDERILEGMKLDKPGYSPTDPEQPTSTSTFPLEILLIGIGGGGLFILLFGWMWKKRGKGEI